MQVLPQKDLMDILQDPIFQNSAPLKKWMEQQLKQVSKMTPGCDDLKNETVQSEKSEDGDGNGKFSAIMAVLFARVDKSTQSSYAQETSQEVCDRLKDLGSNFHPIADLLKADGIDGHFLAHNEISRECLADEYGIRRKIQQDALLSHFEKYKATTPNVAIGLVACSAEMAHRWGHWTHPRHISHEDLKVRAQKMMTYQSASKLMDEAIPTLDQSSNAAPSLDQSSNAAPSLDQSSNGFEVVDYWSLTVFGSESSLDEVHLDEVHLLLSERADGLRLVVASCLALPQRGLPQTRTIDLAMAFISANHGREHAWILTWNQKSAGQWKETRKDSYLQL